MNDDRPDVDESAYAACHAAPAINSDCCERDKQVQAAKPSRTLASALKPPANWKTSHAASVQHASNVRNVERSSRSVMSGCSRLDIIEG